MEQIPKLRYETTEQVACRMQESPFKFYSALYVYINSNILLVILNMVEVLMVGGK